MKKQPDKSDNIVPIYPFEIFAKIVQIECKATSLLDCFAEMQPILSNDSANPQRKATSLLDCFAEMQPILSNDSANPQRKATSLLDCFAEMQPIFCKDTKN